MKWTEFLEKTADMPVIESELLLTGISNQVPVKVQLMRWVKAGRLIQLKRGFYVLSGVYRKTAVYEPYLAFVLKKPSYISLEKALEFHGMIPEAVPVFTSVTTKRPGKITTPLGVFDYRHIKPGLFWGYEPQSVGGQRAYFASPEKALLDLIYLRGMKVTKEWFKELRLQNTGKLDPGKLTAYALRFKSPGMKKAVARVKEYLSLLNEEEQTL